MFNLKQRYLNYRVTAYRKEHINDTKDNIDFLNATVRLLKDIDIGTYHGRINQSKMLTLWTATAEDLINLLTVLEKLVTLKKDIPVNVLSDYIMSEKTYEQWLTDTDGYETSPDWVYSNLLASLQTIQKGLDEIDNIDNGRTPYYRRRLGLIFTDVRILMDNLLD